MVPEKRIVSIVRGSGDPESAVGALVDAANEAGGVDNVTVVLVSIGELPQGLPAAPFPKDGETATADGAPRTVETGDPVTRETDTGAGPILGECGATAVEAADSNGEKPAGSAWSRIKSWFHISK